MTACGAATKKPEVWDLYQLPQAAAPVGSPQPQRDNDSYYYAPKSFSNCNTIGDAPSCAGGG
jgi:hypothetical protein